jgi:hypothetical protein
VTFEVPVSAVSRSRMPLGVVVVAGVAGLIVLGAVVAGLVDPSGSKLAPRAAAAIVAPTSTPAPDALVYAPQPRFEPASFNRPLPTAIACHDVDLAQCHRIVRAALRVLPDDLPTVGGADVWGSLVCNDNFDCPATYLRDSDPAGSVVLGFVDGSPDAALNVVDWGYGPSIRLGLRAWIVRTVPQG